MRCKKKRNPFKCLFKPLLNMYSCNEWIFIYNKKTYKKKKRKKKTKIKKFRIKII
jgi:hypothetical protein